MAGIGVGKQKFDPEGDGYDMDTAVSAGLKPDASGHWPSREPKTGLILKGRGHETYKQAEDGELDAGHEIQKGKDGRYYSQPIGQRYLKPKR